VLDLENIRDLKLTRPHQFPYVAIFGQELFVG
jgi:hypothetical protein